MLPFLKAVDIKTKEQANTSQLCELGSEFVKSVADVMDNTELFMEVVTDICLLCLVVWRVISVANVIA